MRQAGFCHSVYPSYWFIPLSLCPLPTSPSSWTFLCLVIFTEPSLKQPVACKNVLRLRMKAETDSEGLENQSGGWVRGSGKGHNKKKGLPTPSFPVPASIFPFKFNLSLPLHLAFKSSSTRSELHTCARPHTRTRFIKRPKFLRRPFQALFINYCALRRNESPPKSQHSALMV